MSKRLKIKKVIFIAEDEDGTRYRGTVNPWNERRKRHDFTAAFWDDESVGRLFAHYYPNDMSTFEGIREDWAKIQSREGRSILRCPFGKDNIYSDDLIEMWNREQGGEAPGDTAVMLKSYASRPDKVVNWRKKSDDDCDEHDEDQDDSNTKDRR